MISATIGATGIELDEPRVGARNEAARANTPGALYAQIEWAANKMHAVGFPQSIVTTYAIAQMMLESDWFTSNVANTDNNFSGIKYLGKSFQKATKGLHSPEGGNYAHYATFEDWARDFLRILSLNTGGQGRPIDATTAAEYGNRLRANHYFTDPAYAVKFNNALRKVTQALNFQSGQNKQFVDQRNAGQNTFTYGDKGLESNDKFNADRFFSKIQHWAEDHPIAAAAAGVGTLLLVITAVKK